MLKFKLSEDKKWLILLSAEDELEKRQLELSLTKKINNWFFHPLVKKKIWDGNICFVDKKGGFWKVSIGLWKEVYDIGEQYDIDIQIEGLEDLFVKDLTLEDFQEWVDEFFEGKEIIPRDYQVHAAWKIIKYKYSVSEIATSSGKTLISFMIFAYLKSHKLIKKFMVIVPNTNLVFQGSDDFDDYGLSDLKGSKIQQIGGGSKLREGCDIIMGTFQSLVKKDESFFTDVDAVFVDECLHPTSKVLLANGKSQDIQYVNEGQMVYTINEDTGEKEIREVEYIYKNLNKGHQIYEIETKGGKVLKLTGNHKVKLINGDWKKVEDLNLSDELWDI